MTLRPRSSVSTSCPSMLLSAAATVCSTSSGVNGMSSTISRAVCSTPTLTSTLDLLRSVSATSCRDEPWCSTLVERSARRGGTRCAVSERRISPGSDVLTWEVGDAPPQQRLEQPDRVLLAEGALLGEPPPRRDLSGTRQCGGQQLRLGPAEAGVRGDGVGDGEHRAPGDVLHPVADGRFVDQVAFEDQPEGAVVVGAVDEAEVRRQDAVDALTVVGGAGEGGHDGVVEGLRLGVEQ